MRLCSYCGLEKSPISRGNGLFRYNCKPCDSKRQRAYRQDPAGKMAVAKSKRRSKLMKNYGLTEEMWNAQLAKQGGKCAVCGCVPKLFHTDHEHVQGYKKMPAEEKRKYFRGLICYRCNYFYLARGMNSRMAGSVLNYLVSYETRSSENI